MPIENLKHILFLSVLVCVKVSVPVIMLAFSTKLQPKGSPELPVSKYSDFKWDARVCFLSLPPDQNVEIQISTLAAGAAQLWRLPPPVPSKSSHVITSQQSTKRIPPSERLLSLKHFFKSWLYQLKHSLWWL